MVMTNRPKAKHHKLDGLRFDSTLELNFYKRLKACVGDSFEIIREPKIQIGVNRFWKIDFQVGHLLVELKGFDDPRLSDKLAAFCRWQYERKGDFLLVYAQKPYCVPPGIRQFSSSAAIGVIVTRLQEHAQKTADFKL